MLLQIHRKRVYLLLLCVILLLFLLLKKWNMWKVQSVAFVPSYYGHLNCSFLFQETTNNTILKQAKIWQPYPYEVSSDSHFNQEISKSCAEFLKKKKYFLNLSKTKSEKEFQIAFTILVYKTFSQVERLFRTIYRPWNYYCIHVDRKSSPHFFKSVQQLANCLNKKYNNIINIEKRLDVQWGTMSVLEADLNCMKELFFKYPKWKYLINLTGQEFPLKTNAELVEILKSYKGANNIDATFLKRKEERISKQKLPFPVVWYRGSVHITANRKFIEFIFTSNKSKVLLDALKNQITPDEQFFSTLNYNAQFRIPGSFIGDPEENMSKKYGETFLTRYKIWDKRFCESKFMFKNICILGVKDLRNLVTAPHLFSNKYFEDFQPATLMCLEKWYYDKVEREIISGGAEIDTNFYSSMTFVENQFQINDL